MIPQVQQYFCVRARAVQILCLALTVLQCRCVPFLVGSGAAKTNSLGEELLTSAISPPVSQHADGGAQPHNATTSELRRRRFALPSTTKKLGVQELSARERSTTSAAPCGLVVGPPRSAGTGGEADKTQSETQRQQVGSAGGRRDERSFVLQSCNEESFLSTVTQEEYPCSRFVVPPDEKPPFLGEETQHQICCDVEGSTQATVTPEDGPTTTGSPKNVEEDGCTGTGGPTLVVQTHSILSAVGIKFLVPPEVQAKALAAGSDSATASVYDISRAPSGLFSRVLTSESDIMAAAAAESGCASPYPQSPIAGCTAAAGLGLGSAENHEDDHRFSAQPQGASPPQSRESGGELCGKHTQGSKPRQRGRSKSISRTSAGWPMLAGKNIADFTPRSSSASPAAFEPPARPRTFLARAVKTLSQVWTPLLRCQGRAPEVVRDGAPSTPEDDTMALTEDQDAAGQLPAPLLSHLYQPQQQQLRSREKQTLIACGAAAAHCHVEGSLPVSTATGSSGSNSTTYLELPSSSPIVNAPSTARLEPVSRSAPLMSSDGVGLAQCFGGGRHRRSSPGTRNTGTTGLDDDVSNDERELAEAADNLTIEEEGALGADEQDDGVRRSSYLCATARTGMSDLLRLSPREALSRCCEPLALAQLRGPGREDFSSVANHVRQGTMSLPLGNVQKEEEQEVGVDVVSRELPVVVQGVARRASTYGDVGVVRQEGQWHRSPYHAGQPMIGGELRRSCYAANFFGRQKGFLHEDLTAVKERGSAPDGTGDELALEGARAELRLVDWSVCRADAEFMRRAQSCP